MDVGIEFGKGSANVKSKSYLWLQNCLNALVLQVV
jgi:hypothetical protein